MTLREEKKPDLAILDLMMPGLNGFQVLDLIRQRSSIPVIMLTARCEVDTIHASLTMGADDFIKKPFSPLELMARVRAKLRYARPEVTIKTKYY